MVSCPFGAIADKSQIFQLIRAMQSGRKIIAQVAPAFVGQFGKNIPPAKIKAALKELGAKRVVPLKVSGPFHSKMLIPAGEKLERVLEDVELSDFTIPYVSNLMGDYVRDTKEIKFLLKMQISSPVKWQQSVEKMIEEGVDTFVEIGPGRTLSGFMKKINKEVKVLNIDKYEDLEKALDELKGEVAADA